MKQSEKDQHLAAHLPGLLDYHMLMLSDGVRNKLLSEAIERHVTSETRFLDVGAGTGVWAILAAKLGAKRVVAIEIEESLIPIIYRHAQENGVADRIEIIHGSSDDVRIRGRFDVIVSELFGSNAFGEQTIRSFVNVRERFLAPGGVLIPQAMSTLVAPVNFTSKAASTAAGLPISSSFLRSVKLNYAHAVEISDRENLRFLASPAELFRVDFTSIDSALDNSRCSASWELQNLREANGIVMFNYSFFTDDIRMDNVGSQSWGTYIYEFDPFDLETGVLRFDFASDQKKSIWTICLPSHPEIKPQSYSATFAAARIRMAQKLTPHRQFRPPKPKTA